MKNQEAAEKYYKGFYNRPDGEDRGWEEFKYLYEDTPGWNALKQLGGEVIRIEHLYTQSMVCTVYMEIAFERGWLDGLDVESAPEWEQFILELRDDVGNQVIYEQDGMSKQLLMRVVVLELL